MSYIQLFKIDAVVPEDDGEIVLGSTREKVMDRNLDNEALSFIRDLITAVDELDEDDVLVIRKVIF